VNSRLGPGTWMNRSEATVNASSWLEDGTHVFSPHREPRANRFPHPGPHPAGNRAVNPGPPVPESRRRRRPDAGGRRARGWSA
jgi:hypothetical protein